MGLQQIALDLYNDIDFHDKKFQIFTLGLFRDEIYRAAIADQATSPYLDNIICKIAAIACFTYGSSLVLGSMYKLGIVGTYLGDHFGFLFDERIVSFPFNICDNPMYDGSTLCFLGTGLFYAKPAGLFATALVYTMYQIVLLIEEPFTAKIYSNREEKKK
ncbi:Phosphatidyl-N-methylethanolamine N-methyltransferase [Pichia californica]|uniref:Phosphatidyl-N-methylethanolamine N-methyltransferase n=1 Tax=Pichia californica TaxID=460514 RepID=A0A9P6WLJ0_9ASCO|nr:Phosphatidyl-N-methylethanolamine N-methyltransferase [[Candida] californica]KAG0688342.1 Phosphatidyl-N-methylethanolamine N-methyltransferase [[Candida] californica]